uniref:COMM domain-containing protein n=1 Tax=Aureoumbra lagunensis TaxID=44058 RepID=A0A7S3K4B9_9STRA|mmetsp:Transcript_26321/g.33158  ORF Transcript_26321/g.33158 Transcript_26321/m.33158 type:complete len:206 (+) Transcript_26321:13-630(+)
MSTTKPVEVVNGISADALGSIAKRLIRRLGDSSFSRLLDEDEERQAINTLKINEADLNALVQFSAYVFEEAAYQTQEPDSFEAHLNESLGVLPKHASVMRNVWESEATAYIGRLREKHLLGSKILSDTTWTTHLCVATSDDDPASTKGPPRSKSDKKNTQATSVFNLHMNNDSEPPLAIEFSHQELYAFFQKLQDIQHGIDSLSS